MYLSKLQNIFVEADQVELVGVLLRLNPSRFVIVEKYEFVQMAECICLNYKMYSSKLQNVFV